MQTSAARDLQSQIDLRWRCQSWRSLNLLQELAAQTWRNRRSLFEKQMDYLPVSVMSVMVQNPTEMPYRALQLHQRQVHQVQRERRTLASTSVQMLVVWTRLRHRVMALMSVQRQVL